MATVLSDVNPQQEVDLAFANISPAFASRDPLSLTEQESRILALHDQLGELKLEQALLEAQLSVKQGPFLNEDEAQRLLKTTEVECLEARASYLLKNSIVNSVLQADPMLKAVHSGPNGSQTERTLHPLVDQRDILSIAHANLSASLEEVLNTTASTQTANIKATRKNQELTASLLALTDQLKKDDPEKIDDIKLRTELDSVQVEVKEARRRFRIMKSLVAAVVAGSGVDWANDDELRDLVLDGED